ncbi:MAG: hypothetical protein EHM47_00635 [Ignavibacteriales bacterium]|nr:MAG: hypothetical protein EHM47_00635 [Ignavibacteriales bacterium]
MRKGFLFMVIFLILSLQTFAQVEDRFGFFTESEITEYARPFGTTLGMAFNSGSYHSAEVADFFGFSIGFKGMYIFIPNDDLTFTPSLPQGYSAEQKTATIYGNEGAAYYGPQGFIVYPQGINETSIPAVLPQISASLMGTEVMLRYLPSISLGSGDEELSMFGIGVKHSISRYIPLIPVDVAVQFLYNNLEITGVMDITAIAFNAHASRSFGLFTLYGGLQYESSTFDLEYEFTNPSNLPSVQPGNVKVSIDGDNNFRGTLGGSVKLAVIALNIDYSLGAQSVLSGGLTFEF